MKVKIKNYEYLDRSYRGYSECYIKTETVIEVPRNGKICITNWTKDSLTVNVTDGDRFFSRKLPLNNFEIIIEKA